MFTYLEEDPYCGIKMSYIENIDNSSPVPQSIAAHEPGIVFLGPPYTAAARTLPPGAPAVPA